MILDCSILGQLTDGPPRPLLYHPPILSLSLQPVPGFYDPQISPSYSSASASTNNSPQMSFPNNHVEGFPSGQWSGAASYAGSEERATSVDLNTVDGYYHNGLPVLMNHDAEIFGSVIEEQGGSDHIHDEGYDEEAEP